MHREACKLPHDDVHASPYACCLPMHMHGTCTQSAERVHLAAGREAYLASKLAEAHRSELEASEIMTRSDEIVTRSNEISRHDDRRAQVHVHERRYICT